MGGMHFQATRSRRGHFFQLFPGQIVESEDSCTWRGVNKQRPGEQERESVHQ